MLDNLRTTLRGKFMVVATAFGNYDRGEKILKRGTNETQRDTALREVIHHSDSQGFITRLLEKGTSEWSRDYALRETIAGINTFGKTHLLIAAGTSEKGRDRALGHLAVSGSGQSAAREKINLLFDTGVSNEGLRDAIAGAARSGNAETLSALFACLEDGSKGVTIPQRIKEEAVRDLRRRDLTIGVEKLLLARDLMPKL